MSNNALPPPTNQSVPLSYAAITRINAPQPTNPINLPPVTISTRPDFSTIEMSYNTIWANSPFTNFDMFNRLIKHVGCGEHGPMGSWEAFFQKTSPNLASAGLQASSIGLPSDESFVHRPGTCTSFAIQVARNAVVNDIRYGTANKHRAAWTMDGPTAAVIDSSARQAIEFKDIRIPQSIDENIWFFLDNQLWSRKRGGKSTAFKAFPKGGEAWKSALQLCLRETLDKPQMLILFRRVEDNWNCFHSMMTWDFNMRTFTWSSSKLSTLHVVTFKRRSSAGTVSVSEDGVDIQSLLAAWVAESKWRREQFTSELQAIQKEVWAAAVKCWGDPSHNVIEKGF